MTDPYDVLGVPPDAGEAEVRKRYLELVRAFPPDRAPERFAAVRAAYEQLHDPIRRLESTLLRPARHDSIGSIAAELRDRLASARLPVDALLALADAP